MKIKQDASSEFNNSIGFTMLFAKVGIGLME